MDMWLKFMLSLDLVENTEGTLENKINQKDIYVVLTMKKKELELGVMEC